MKILFCQLRTHGDIIRTFPAIDLIKQYIPDAEFYATGFADMESTWKLQPHIRDFIPQPVLKSGSGHGQFSCLVDCTPLEDSVSLARKIEIDYYIDFQGCLQSALFGVACQIPVRAGHDRTIAKDGAHLFYTFWAQDISSGVNRMLRHCLLAAQLFPGLPDPKRPEIRNGKNILIIPGTSYLGRLKKWPLENYARLAEKLLTMGDRKVNIAFGPEEEELTYAAQSLFPREVGIIKVNSFSAYITEYFKDCACVIGNDSAPLHLAIWQNIPTCMLIGPTLPEINAPWIFAKGAFLAGVHCPDCNLWSGHCIRNISCLREISVSEVFDSVYRILTSET